MLSRRWEHCLLLLGARLCCQTNRIILGALMPLISAEIVLSPHEKGSVLSAFATGYMLTQIVGGRLADQIGGKGIITFALFGIAGGTLICPFVANSYLPFYATYFSMGVMEGPSYPSSGAMLSKWFPSGEKASAASWVDTGGSIGGIIGLTLAPLLAAQIGWRGAFMLYGGLSMVFVCVWHLRAQSNPGECSRLTTEEKELLQKAGLLAQPGVRGRPQSKGRTESGTEVVVESSGWTMLRHPAALAVIWASVVFNFGRYFFYAWFPTYFVEAWKVRALDVGMYMFLPQIADTCVKTVVGPLTDRLVAKGTLSRLTARRFSSCTGFLGFGTCMALCSLVSSPEQASLLMFFGKGLGSFHAGGFKTNYLDLSKKHTGLLIGVANTLATGSSMIAPLAAGKWFEIGGDWETVFCTVFLVNLTGALVFGFFSQVEVIDGSDDDKRQ
eukprot:Hpha_TRINITY_DN34621_c0_g1::TRINITY_DN34621_c0_g1_i1::g.21159::m.21159/K08193/SLC17A; MFS transporter, ACS family, solute carrier family 17 (sodium-dependent inorganic phosphate cotransporter), other